MKPLINLKLSNPDMIEALGESSKPQRILKEPCLNPKP